MNSFINVCALLPFLATVTYGLSSNPAFGISDRFKAVCPADRSTIAQFSPSLINGGTGDDEKSTWVAVYRSSNNLPSVIVKDSFMNAMRIATEEQTDGASQSTAIDNSSLKDQIQTSAGITKDKTIGSEDTTGVNANIPVAVARLSPSLHFDGQWLIESMRCSLKKEDTNEDCDGNSEHAEAISVCIDELILHHLREGRNFDGEIRTKATLVSSKLLDERGFAEVTHLCSDMATHTSNLDSSMIKYAERVVATVSKGPGARDRALQILNYLGKQEASTKQDESSADSDNDDIDPWATIKQFI